MAWEKQEGMGIWIPKEKGDEIVGEITGIDKEGTYGTQWMIKTENDEFRTPSHKVLQNRMVKAKMGDKVRIIYTGQEPPAVRGNNPTEMYEVYIEK